jgi:hypothetical protein
MRKVSDKRREKQVEPFPVDQALVDQSVNQRHRRRDVSFHEIELDGARVGVDCRCVHVTSHVPDNVTSHSFIALPDSFRRRMIVIFLEAKISN